MTREKSKKNEKNEEYSVDRLQEIKKKEKAHRKLIEIEEI